MSVLKVLVIILICLMNTIEAMSFMGPTDSITIFINEEWAGVGIVQLAVTSVVWIMTVTVPLDININFYTICHVFLQ